MPNPTAAMLVIGDEILSGRTRDANMHYLAGELARVGIDLEEVRIVSDKAPRIVAALNALRGGYDHVFTSGGIGPTHDDITADAVAAAFGVGIGVRDDARAILAAHYQRTGLELNAARLRMARIPDGAALIDNPVSSAPGFSLGNVHVMAGVPAVFQAMVASVLPGFAGGGRRFTARPCASGAARERSRARCPTLPAPIQTCRSAATRSSATGRLPSTWWCAGPTRRRSTRSWSRFCAQFPEAVA